MNCQHCQAPLKPGAVTCPACGQPVGLPAASPPSVTPTTPAHRLPPATGKAAQTIFIDFNQSPREIVRVMAEAQQKADAFKAQRRRRQIWLWLLFPAGLPFLCFDVWLGYNLCTFTLVALTLWLGAIAGLIWFWRQGKGPQFGPRYTLTHTLFETLKDDVSPKHTLVGWLDLTGAAQESKATRQKNSQSGQPIIYYRDEWLRLKTRLYDGNALRLSLTDRVKARQGFWKRSRISHKNKWRSGSSQSLYELQFSVSVSPDSYQVLPIQPQTAIPNSRFVLQQVEAGAGRLSLSAATTADFDAWDVLNVLRFGYNHLRTMSA